MKLERFVSKRGAEAWYVGYRAEKLNGTRMPAQRELGEMSRDEAIKAAMAFGMKLLGEKLYFVPVNIGIGEGHDLVAFLFTAEQRDAFSARVLVMASALVEQNAATVPALGDVQGESTDSSTKPEPVTPIEPEPVTSAAAPATSAAKSDEPEPAPKANPAPPKSSKPAESSAPHEKEKHKKHGR